MEIKLKAAQLGSKYVAFNSDADLSEINVATLHEWTAQAISATTGTSIAVAALFPKLLKKSGAEKNEFGDYDQSIREAIYPIAFAQVHLTAITGPDVSIDKPTPETLEALPLTILRAMVAKADPTSPLTRAEVAELKKPVPDNPEA